jgi:hypothetical protein
MRLKLLLLTAILLLLPSCAPGDAWTERLYLGDTLFLDGKQVSPASYGELYEVSEGGNAIALTDAGTFYQWVSSTIGETPGTDYVAGSVATDSLTIGPKGAGTYMVMMSYSFSGSVNTLMEGAIFLNGVRQDRLEFNRFLGAGGDQGFAGIMGIVDLSAGDVLDFRIKADGAAKTVATRHASLAINRIGR